MFFHIEGYYYHTETLLIHEPFFCFPHHLQCKEILAGVESVPEAPLLTLRIVAFCEGQPTHTQPRLLLCS